MAIEIGQRGVINVKRPNRGFLLDIKAGKYDYEELIELAALKQLEMNAAFQTSKLLDKPDLEYINRLAFELRNRYYLST